MSRKGDITCGPLSRECQIITCICGETRVHIVRVRFTKLYTTLEVAEQLGADAHICTNPSCSLYTDLSQVEPKWRLAPLEYAV